VPEPFPPSNPLETSGYNAPALTDWTGNGQYDLFVGVLGGSSDANASLADNFYFYEHTGTEYRLRSRQFVGGLDVGSESATAVGDLDGDGTADVLVANKIEPTEGATSRVSRLSRQQEAGAPVYQLDGHLDLPSAYQYAPALGDLTGDGPPTSCWVRGGRRG
jgi:FG-GAP repeat.